MTHPRLKVAVAGLFLAFSSKEKPEPESDLRAAIPTWRGMFGGGGYVAPPAGPKEAGGDDVQEMKSASETSAARGGVLGRSYGGARRPRVHGETGVVAGPRGTGQHGTVVIENPKGPSITLFGGAYRS